jgi:hypothetical protein
MGNGKLSLKSRRNLLTKLSGLKKNGKGNCQGLLDQYNETKKRSKSKLGGILAKNKKFPRQSGGGEGN